MEGCFIRPSQDALFSLIVVEPAAMHYMRRHKIHQNGNTPSVPYTADPEHESERAVALVDKQSFQSVSVELAWGKEDTG